MATDNFKHATDMILERTVACTPRVPGVVAMATDRRGNFYEGVAGERVIGGPAMTFDSVFAIHSTTKAITGTAVLKAVEEGKLDLDAPAKNYVPDIGKLQVIQGFDQAGKPKLRAPKRDITTLMLHTAGFGYEFFNGTYHRLVEEQLYPSAPTASKASLMTPLLFDPARAGNMAPVSTGAV